MTISLFEALLTLVLEEGQALEAHQVNAVLANPQAMAERWVALRAQAAAEIEAGAGACFGIHPMPLDGGMPTEDMLALSREEIPQNQFQFDEPAPAQDLGLEDGPLFEAEMDA